MNPALENEIRKAVAGGAFARADQLLDGYCKQIRTAEEKLHAMELLEWMLKRTSAARAFDAARLKELLGAMQYRQLRPPRLHTWQIEG